MSRIAKLIIQPTVFVISSTLLISCGLPIVPSPGKSTPSSLALSENVSEPSSSTSELLDNTSQRSTTESETNVHPEITKCLAELINTAAEKAQTTADEYRNDSDISQLGNHYNTYYDAERGFSLMFTQNRNDTVSPPEDSISVNFMTYGTGNLPTGDLLSIKTIDLAAIGQHGESASIIGLTFPTNDTSKTPLENLLESDHTQAKIEKNTFVSIVGEPKQRSIARVKKGEITARDLCAAAEFITARIAYF